MVLCAHLLKHIKFACFHTFLCLRFLIFFTIIPFFASQTEWYLNLTLRPNRNGAIPGCIFKPLCGPAVFALFVTWSVLLHNSFF